MSDRAAKALDKALQDYKFGRFTLKQWMTAATKDKQYITREIVPKFAREYRFTQQDAKDEIWRLIMLHMAETGHLQYNKDGTFSRL